MIKTIKIQDLHVGMHVIMPDSWLKHPHESNNFNIRSAGQIREIIACGFEEVTIDTSQGMPVYEFESISHADLRPVPPKVWAPDELVPVLLREAIHDPGLQPEKKAQVVYESSIELMGRLMEDPKTENIVEAKDAIGDIVDMIITQEATSDCLFRITSHDYYTYTHSVNVGILSVMLSKHLFKNYYEHDMRELGAGFFLHDLGKVRIDPAIINKPGKLTEDEMKQMRAHPYQSYLLLKEANQLSEECGIIAMQHHEREDGKGYPRGLKGDDIHIYGRICAIADVFDSLTSDRSYKARFNTFDALRIMREEMLYHFHRQLFEEFVLLFAASR